VNSEEKLVSHLGEMYQSKNVYLHYRASGLFYTFLKSLAKEGQGVLLPDISGFSLAQVVISAGYIPVFVDVSAEDYNMTLDSTSRAISNSKVPIAVCLAIHSFGHFLELPTIRKHCDRNNIILVEDICQLIGTGAEGKWGHVILASFGNHKPLDGGSGGAIIFKSEDLASLWNRGFLNNFIVDKQTETHFMRQYYEIRNRKMLRKKSSGVANLTAKNLQYILNGSVMTDWEKVMSATKKIKENNQIRVEKAQYMYSRLSTNESIELPVTSEKSVPWRLTFVVKETNQRDKLVNELRKQVHHVSTWYHALSLDFPSESPSYCVNAISISSRVINLRVDNSVGIDYLDQSIKCINDFNRSHNR